MNSYILNLIKSTSEVASSVENNDIASLFNTLFALGIINQQSLYDIQQYYEEIIDDTI